MYHVPMCEWCGEHEVGTFGAFVDFCSEKCADECDRHVHRFEEDGEPAGSHDLSDDADALTSAGFGTDEDYGFYGEDY